MSQGWAQVAKVNMKRNIAFESNVVPSFFKFNSTALVMMLYLLCTCYFIHSSLLFCQINVKNSFLWKTVIYLGLIFTPSP